MILISKISKYTLKFTYTLKFFRLKTWLRTKMSQDRLCGLALLHIHREHDISQDTIIERFANSKKRNIDFVI